MTPPLTVLMAVHNGRAFVRPAVESILAQTYRDFRFLIVDDGSTDATREIVRSYDDARIELLALERNIGQTAALNFGLRRASTPWIARMDADDVSAPTRFEEQMRLLAQEPSLRCVGTHAWEFRENPAQRDSIVTRPETYADIKRAALQGAGIIHGTIIVSREAILAVGAYNERFRYASDREMFIRLLARHPAANIPRPLLGIRRHPNQDSFSKIAADEYIEIFADLLRSTGFTPAEAGILRRSLSYAYLFRAGHFQSQRQYAAWGEDVARALRWSPSTCVRRWAGAASEHLLPKRWQISLRRGGFVRPAA